MAETKKSILTEILDIAYSQEKMVKFLQDFAEQIFASLGVQEPYSQKSQTKLKKLLEDYAINQRDQQIKRLSEQFSMKELCVVRTFYYSKIGNCWLTSFAEAMDMNKMMNDPATVKFSEQLKELMEEELERKMSMN